MVNSQELPLPTTKVRSYQDFYKVLICIKALARNLKKFERVHESSSSSRNCLRSGNCQAAY